MEGKPTHSSRSSLKFAGPQGTRLDKFLAEAIPGVSRGEVKRMITAGLVSINRTTCRIHGKALIPGAIIRWQLQSAAANDTADREKKTANPLLAEWIVYEDAHLIAVNKPPQLPSQPTRDPKRENLFDLLREFLAERDGVRPTNRYYLAIHHRLDRDTSGLLLFTKTKLRNKAITDAFRDRTARKQYLAVVEGNFPAEKLTATNRVSERADRKGAYPVVSKGGHSAHTDFTRISVAKRDGQLVSLVLAEPRTGRTHQIRSHLGALGFPIVGDPLYGAKHFLSPRTLLHAFSLEILEFHWRAPVPKDLAHFFPRECKALEDVKPGAKAD